MWLNFYCSFSGMCKRIVNFYLKISSSEAHGNRHLSYQFFPVWSNGSWNTMGNFLGVIWCWYYQLEDIPCCRKLHSLVYRRAHSGKWGVPTNGSIFSNLPSIQRCYPCWMDHPHVTVYKSKEKFRAHKIITGTLSAAGLYLWLEWLIS